MMRFALLLLVACSSSPDIHINALCDTDAAVDSADAPPDAAPDASPDAPPPSCRSFTWRPIYTGLLGADGFDLGTYNGVLLATVPWEEGGRVTLHRRDPVTLAWATVTIPTNVGPAEHAFFLGDYDNDGNAPDIGIASENGKGYIAFAPPVADLLVPSAWSTHEITASAGLGSRWMQVATYTEATGAKRLCLGGRAGSLAGSVGRIACFSSPTPRVSSSWTQHYVDQAGWTMSLVAIDWNSDGHTDMFTSDRSAVPPDYSRRGDRVLLNNGDGTWTNYQIANYPNARFSHVTSRSEVISGTATSAASTLAIRQLDAAGAWIVTNVPYPSEVGQYHDVEPADIDGDGARDLVLSHSYATGTQSGVVYLRGPDFTERCDVSGALGSKHDNAGAFDMDADGDLDIPDTEQIDGLGFGYWEQL